MYLYLHAPRPIAANPPNPRSSSPTNVNVEGHGQRRLNDSRAARQLTYEPENNRVITIDL
jgi:hypothetical protein